MEKERRIQMDSRGKEESTAYVKVLNTIFAGIDQECFKLYHNLRLQKKHGIFWKRYMKELKK